MVTYKNVKILIVDDSSSTLNLEVKMLRELGFENIVAASDGQIAIEKINKADDVQMIITDWDMPNKNGLELLKWIRSNEKFKKIPVIMATDQGEKKKILMAKNAGATDYIIKPVDKQELNSVLIRVLSNETIKKEKQAIKKHKTKSGKALLRVAHIQITDHLTLGVLKHLIQIKELKPKYFELETICMPGWNPVLKNLERGDVNAAFILAPIAMDLFSFGIPIKLVLLAHRNGSICVRQIKDSVKEITIESLKASFINKDFLIPHLLSIHHMLSNMFLKKLGLKPGLSGHKKDINVFFEVVPPVKMPEFIKNNANVGGYMVAEPLGSKAIFSGISDLAFLSSDIWENHPCCVVTIRDDFINKNTDAAHEFVNMIVKAGLYINDNPDEAAKIAVDFLDNEKNLGLETHVIKSILKQQLGVTKKDLYPQLEEIDKIQRYMSEEMNIGQLIDLEKFIDIKFADEACKFEKDINHVPATYNVEKFISGIAGLKSKKY